MSTANNWRTKRTGRNKSPTEKVVRIATPGRPQCYASSRLVACRCFEGEVRVYRASLCLATSATRDESVSDSQMLSDKGNLFAATETWKLQQAKKTLHLRKRT